MSKVGSKENENKENQNTPLLQTPQKDPPPRPSQRSESKGLSIGVRNQGLKLKYPYLEHQRTTTDSLCAILFICCTIVWAFTSIVGLFAGNLNNFMQPYDQSGNPCGRSLEGTQKYPFLYLTTLDPTKWAKNNVCVKQCPEAENSKIECFATKNITDCNRDIKILSTTLVMNRFCYPDGQKLEDEVAGEVNTKPTNKSFLDFSDSWLTILMAFLLTVIISCLFLLSVRLCSLITIYSIAVSLIVVMVILGIFFMKQFSKGKEVQFSTGNMYTWFLLGTAVCWLFGIFFGIFFFCFFLDNVKISAKVLEISGYYLSENKIALLLPILSSVVFVVYQFYYFIAGTYLFTIGYTEAQEGLPFGKIKWSKVMW